MIGRVGDPVGGLVLGALGRGVGGEERLEDLRLLTHLLVGPLGDGGGGGFGPLGDGGAAGYRGPRRHLWGRNRGRNRGCE